MPLNCEGQCLLFLEFRKLIAWHPGDGRALGPEPWTWTTLWESAVSCGLLPPLVHAALGYRLLSPSGSQGQNPIESNRAQVPISREADAAL